MGNKSLFNRIPSSQFGIGGDKEATKLLEFDCNDQAPNTTVTIKTSSETSSDIEITLPPTSGTLGFRGSFIDFSKRYWSVQHWVAANTNGCNNWTNTAAGTGVNLFIRNATSIMQGGVTLQTGTQTGGRVVVSTSTNCVQAGSDELTYETTVILGALSTVGDRYTANLGFGDKVDQASNNNCALMGYNDSVSANWCLITSAGGSTTVTDTGVPATTDLTRLKVVIARNGSAAYGYVNNVLVATSVTNIPTTAGQYMAMIAGILKSTGTTSVDLSVGPIYLGVDYT